ncbi:dynein regulatory complex protein 1 [Xenentodon cancila]
MGETETVFANNGHQQEIKVRLTNDINESEWDLKNLWDKELERLTEWTKEVEMNEETFHNTLLEITHRIKIQELEKEMRRDWSSLFRRFNGIDKFLDLQDLWETQHQNLLLATISKYRDEIHRHFANVDDRNLEKMWLLTEAELKQVLERALAIDSLICKQYFGLAWKRPNLPSLELFGPTQPQKLASQLSQPFETEKCSPESDTESPCTELFSVGAAAQPRSSPEWEEGKLPREALKKVMELLCDEADFLMEDEVLKILSSLDKEEQTAVKLGSLCCSLGIGDEDVPKLVDFLIKYEQQRREQTEDACPESSGLTEGMETNATSNPPPDLILPNHVLPALKSFLEQHRRSKESAAQQLFSFSNPAVLNSLWLISEGTEKKSRARKSRPTAAVSSTAQCSLYCLQARMHIVLIGLSNHDMLVSGRLHRNIQRLNNVLPSVR